MFSHSQEYIQCLELRKLKSFEVILKERSLSQVDPTDNGISDHDAWSRRLSVGSLSEN